MNDYSRTGRALVAVVATLASLLTAGALEPARGDISSIYFAPVRFDQFITSGVVGTICEDLNGDGLEDLALIRRPYQTSDGTFELSIHLNRAAELS